MHLFLAKTQGRKENKCFYLVALRETALLFNKLFHLSSNKGV